MPLAAELLFVMLVPELPPVKAETNPDRSSVPVAEDCHRDPRRKRRGHRIVEPQRAGIDRQVAGQIVGPLKVNEPSPTLVRALKLS